MKGAKLGRNKIPIFQGKRSNMELRGKLLKTAHIHEVFQGEKTSYMIPGTVCTNSSTQYQTL